MRFFGAEETLRKKPESETYTCLLPWRLGLGALVDEGRPSSESNTSSRVVDPGDGLLVSPAFSNTVKSEDKQTKLKQTICKKKKTV